MITQTFKSHPIGQGFFYTGRIKARGAEYNFVFDCGSLSYSVLNNTIERYKRNQTKDIDLLIISHFDADHINGLKKLLDGKNVKNVVAPFISFKKRISLALNYKSEFDRKKPENVDPNFDLTLTSIVDFSKALENELKGAIFYFVESTNDKPNFPIEEQSIQEFDGFAESFKFSLDNSNPINENERNNLNFQNINENNALKFECDEIGTLTNNGIKVIDFIFYKKQILKNEDAFYDEVYRLFLEENKTLFRKRNEPTFDEIIEAIKSYSNARKIKDLFKKASTNLNLSVNDKELLNLNTTSLSMLHYDKLYLYENLLNRHLHFCNLDFKNVHVYNNEEFYNGNFCNRRFPCRYLRNCGCINTLLTADSYLKNEDDLNNFIEYYGRYLEKLGFLQVPHHGSRHSSDSLLFRRINANFYFINFGLNHCFVKKWSHPNNEVLQNLYATNRFRRFIPVTENSGYQIKFNCSIY
jgi:hypothetical protein